MIPLLEICVMGDFIGSCYDNEADGNESSSQNLSDALLELTKEEGEGDETYCYDMKLYSYDNPRDENNNRQSVEFHIFSDCGKDFLSRTLSLMTSSNKNVIGRIRDFLSRNKTFSNMAIISCEADMPKQYHFDDRISDYLERLVYEYELGGRYDVVLMFIGCDGDEMIDKLVSYGATMLYDESGQRKAIVACDDISISRDEKISVAYVGDVSLCSSTSIALQKGRSALNIKKKIRCQTVSVY